MTRSQPHPPFAVTARTDAGVLTVSIEGDLDLITRDQVMEALDAHESIRDIRFDMAGVTFVDSSGLRVIIHAVQRCDGGGVTVSNPSETFRKLLELTGLDQHVTVDVAS